MIDRLRSLRGPLDLDEWLLERPRPTPVRMWVDTVAPLVGDEEDPVPSRLVADPEDVVDPSTPEEVAERAAASEADTDLYPHMGCASCGEPSGADTWCRTCAAIPEDC